MVVFIHIMCVKWLWVVVVLEVVVVCACVCVVWYMCVKVGGC